MNYRQLPWRIVVCIGLLVLFNQVCMQSYGNNARTTAARPQYTPVTWEYAQLDAQTAFYDKYTEYSWEWIDGQEGVVGFKGRSETSVIRDLCHRLARRGVNAKLHQARDTHLLLLDVIGAQGWEMVEHSEVIKDFATDATAKSSEDQNANSVMARKWLFKREKGR